MDATCSHCVCRQCETPSRPGVSPARRHEIAHRFGKAPQTLGASPAHSRNRRGGQFHAEEIGHQFGQAILRQQLIMQQIDHEGGDFDAILNGRVDPVRKRRSRLRAAGGALAIMRTMFGDDEWLRVGQIKHLTSVWPTLASGPRPAPHLEQADG